MAVKVHFKYHISKYRIAFYVNIKYIEYWINIRSFYLLVSIFSLDSSGVKLLGIPRKISGTLIRHYLFKTKYSKDINVF